MSHQGRWQRVAILASPDDLGRAAAAGFTHVELPALEEDRPAAHLEALADSGLFVACCRLHGALQVAEIEPRREALRRLKLQVDDAARLGATLAFLAPQPTPEATARACFTEGFALLAEHAARRMVRLAVVAGGAGSFLPDAAAALAWAEAEGAPGVVVCGEEVETARRAGQRLAYARAPGPGLLRALGELGHGGPVGVWLENLRDDPSHASNP